jgi:hypothetical protein
VYCGSKVREDLGGGLVGGGLTRKAWLRFWGGKVQMRVVVLGLSGLVYRLLRL